MVEQLHKTGTFNLLIDPALKEAVEKAAAHDHRSVTSLVEKLLTDYLGRRGYIQRRPGQDEGIRPQDLTSDNDG
jgi:hypothetical protein